MKAGISWIDISPAIGVDLSGFAARIQPSTGVLDPLFAKALYLEDGDERLLWIAMDLLALDGKFVGEFRRWCADALKLEAHRVVLTCTHTHAGPATAKLTGCGTMNEDYMRQLQGRMRLVAERATAKTEPVTVVSARKDLRLAIDRRKKPSAHVDPVVTALGFVRADGSYLAAALNYAMHPVALGGGNRSVSTDWCGPAAAALSGELPGAPFVLVSNGACGNINPPKEPASWEEVQGFGQQVAEGMAAMLKSSSERGDGLKVRSITAPMELDVLSPAEIDAYADRWLATIQPGHPWEAPIRLAVETWRKTQKAGGASTFPIELVAARIGPVDCVLVNGEMFTRFTQLLREGSKRPMFVSAYANAAFGYIPRDEAYDEGGYEVESAHFFYNSFRPKRGSLEKLAGRAGDLLKALD